MVVLKLFPAFVTLFYLSCVCASLSHINEFAVHIPGPPDWADHVAQKYGFVNKGQVGSLEGYYRFIHNGIQKRSVVPSEYHVSLLQNDSMVHWCEQQIIKKRVKRANVGTTFSDFPDPLYPEQWFLKRDHGYDMNVHPAWKKGYTGRGIVVSILDDGIQGNHPDLSKNYDKEASWDINDDDDDPSPKDDDDNKHGTRCAGEVAAIANNEFCGVGVAYNARIGGVRMLDGRVTDTIEAAALSLKPNHIHIYSASWGPDDDGKTVDGPGPLAKIAFEDGIKKGRNGLGSIYVWASGNGGKLSDNCNCDGYTNSIYTISISSATEGNYKPWYLEECSSTLATTYSSGTTTIDRNIVTVDVDYSYFEELKQGKKPNASNLCTKKHTGTSASAPIAAGLCALALEANPKLTWRDMQYIIVLTSRYTPLSKEDGWIVNGANRPVSTMFGYGLMDADRMVTFAAKWKSLLEQHICFSAPDITRRIISKEKGDHVEALIYTDGCAGTSNYVRYAEHVQARVSLSFHPRGNLHIMLISPQNTTSSLLFPRPHDAVMDKDSFNDWPFMSVHFWGEEIAGPWKLIIYNVGESSAEYSGSLKNWSITFYGTEDLPDCVKEKKCIEEEYHMKESSGHSYPIRGISEVPGLSAEVCKETNEFLFISENGQRYCVKKCPHGLYSSTKDNLCQKCDESCYSCYGPSYNNCLICPLSSYLHNSTCIKHCPKRYFSGTISSTTSKSENFQQCIPCTSVCLVCEENMYKCSLCIEGFYLFKHRCLPFCPPGTYADDNKCLLCSSECQLCYGPFSSNCLACSPGYYLMDDSCESHCPEKYFIDEEGRCVPCHRSCESCIGQSQCLSCAESNYYRREIEEDCVFHACSQHYPDECGTCHNSRCETCFHADYCNICKTESFWYKGDCYDECPVSTYEILDECKKCGGKCFSCAHNPYDCTLCQNGFFRHQMFCLDKCPKGFYGSKDNVCENCHTSCKECFGPSEFHCIDCSIEKFLLNNSCTLSCPQGYFPAIYSMDDYESIQDIDIAFEKKKDEIRVCVPCHPSCKTCSDYGPSYCTSCYSDRTLIENTCIPCLDGDFFNSHDKICERCDDHCGTCFGPSQNNCLSCLAPLRLHKEKHLCFPCCLSKSNEDCCICSIDLDFCVIPDPYMKYTNISENPEDIFSENLADIAIAGSVVAIMVFFLLFSFLQCKSSELWHHGFRGKKYIPVPRELNATFNYEQEKVCLTQEDADEEDDLFLKT